MGISFLLLFATVMAAGLLVYVVPVSREKCFRLILVFAGSYLFSITILHILPELFSNGRTQAQMGLYILLGFLLQQLLEFWSSGIEHGHIHKDHANSFKGVITVMVGLCIHAFLEGTLLSHGNAMGMDPLHAGHSHSNKTLLLGIILHKGPAAFALAAVLSSSLGKKWTLALLAVFASASPLGMLSSAYFVKSGLLSKEGIGMLYGLVAGSFLHISTTIFFESSPQHKLQLSKLLVIFLAAGLAIVSEYLV